MSFLLHPWHLLLVLLAGWINQQQQQVIEYLRAENRVLHEKLGKKRILFNDDQRRRLRSRVRSSVASDSKKLARSFTPDTILRWHRMFIAKKWDYNDKRKNVAGHESVRRLST